MKTQTITKKDLQVLYKAVCNEWQSKINELLDLQKFEEEVNVENSLVLEAFKQANASQKGLLQKYFTLPKSIADKIKTLDDVFKEAGVTEYDVLVYPKPKNKKQKSINNFAIIQLISEVLNEGWIPDFSNSSERKYYPWFEYKNGTFVFYYVCCGFYRADLGFGCYYKSEELAEYAGKQFIEIYKEYLPS